MVEARKMLLLNGSPRRKGTSYSFAHTIQGLAVQAGCAAEIAHIIDYFDGKHSLDILRAEIAQSDTIGLTAPLYFDSLPYPVVWLFERLAQEMGTELSGKGFFMIVQGGFPDWTLSQPSVGLCRCFAESVGMRWLGGLGYGGGAIIDGAPIESLGAKGAKITRSFQAALDDILYGRVISGKAQELLVMKIPALLLRLLAVFLNLRSKATARRMGVKDLTRRVYLE